MGRVVINRTRAIFRSEMVIVFQLFSHLGSQWLRKFKCMCKSSVGQKVVSRKNLVARSYIIKQIVNGTAVYAIGRFAKHSGSYSRSRISSSASGKGSNRDWSHYLPWLLAFGLLVQCLLSLGTGSGSLAWSSCYFIGCIVHRFNVSQMLDCDFACDKSCSGLTTKLWRDIKFKLRSHLTLNATTSLFNRN